MSWGIVASAGIGLLASQGKSGSQSTKQEMDPRMAPFVFGDKAAGQPGIMDYASGLLGKQMASGTPGFTQMQNIGMGLMGGSVAGNPFAQGYKGGTNFMPQGPMAGNGLGKYVAPAPVAPMQQQAPQAQPYSIDEILAEIARRQKELDAANYKYGGYGGDPGDGMGGGGGYGGEADSGGMSA